jgi:mitochondrial-processing peptidase subunit alpha
MFKLRRYSTRISKLDNGIRVASVDANSHFYSVGVFMEAGAKFESPKSLGSSMLIDKMSYGATKSYKRDELMKKLEGLGGAMQTVCAREHLAYSGLVFPKDLGEMVHLLSEMVDKPNVDEAELKELKENMHWEINLHQWQHQTIFPEYLHAVAFRSNPTKDVIMNFSPFETQGLGNSLIMTKADLDKVTADRMQEFRNKWIRPDRMLVSGVGMEHEQLVDVSTCSVFYCIRFISYNSPQ